MNEINGGVVNATTASGRDSKANRRQHAPMKLAKSAARRHFAVLPKDVVANRWILIPRQVSVLANSFLGSS
jgi:hypothetical protein